MMRKMFLLLTLLISACTTDNMCSSPKCSSSYTVKEPVEVIYQNTTYTTVYEPKTYKSTRYERVPYRCAKQNICR